MWFASLYNWIANQHIGGSFYLELFNSAHTSILHQRSSPNGEEIARFGGRNRSCSSFNEQNDGGRYEQALVRVYNALQNMRLAKEGRTIHPGRENQVFQASTLPSK